VIVTDAKPASYSQHGQAVPEVVNVKSTAKQMGVWIQSRERSGHNKSHREADQSHYREVRPSLKSFIRQHFAFIPLSVGRIQSPRA
jgi:hypothetical protein